MNSDEERDCVCRARAGDRVAFAALVERYWPPVRAWLTGFTGHPQASEDLTQEAFLKAWVALPTLTAPEPFRVWLFRIARNEYLASARRARPALDPPSDAPDRATGPLAAAIEQEELVALSNAIALLPDSYRETYLLWTHENLSYPEIARILDLTEEAARWRVCEARRRLARILEKFLTP